MTKIKLQSRCKNSLNVFTVPYFSLLDSGFKSPNKFVFLKKRGGDFWGYVVASSYISLSF